MIQIIHISDFHIDKKDSYQKRKVVSALIKSLKSTINTDRCIVVITGDLIDKGGAGFKTIDDAFKEFNDVVIERMVSELSISKKQIFFVPGNHDVNRNKADEIMEEGLKSKLNSVDSINEFIDRDEIDNKYLQRMSDFKKFEKTHFQDFEKSELTNFSSSFVIDELDLGIVCLNSSWRCYDESDKETLIIGENQILRALNFVKDKKTIIGLSHHSIEYLSEIDKRNIRPLINSKFDLYLYGHSHSTDFSFTRDFYGKTLYCQAPACMGNKSKHVDYVGGYAIIEFSKETPVQISYKKYLDTHDVFVKNTDIGNDEGVIRISYPDENDIYQNSIVDKSLRNLIEVQCDNVNEHLFTYGTNSTGPCKINEIFVEPIISNLPETHFQMDEIIYYKINDILLNTENFLIYGLKESGKTILLDKFFIELSNSYKLYNQIPVLIKYKEIGSKDISQLIRQFLSISAAEYKDLIQKANITLLVDDIDFNTGNVNLSKLAHFFNTNSNIRIIAAREQIIESNLPEDFIDSNINFNFNLAFIQNFKSAQIKELITRWFPEQNDDYKDRINRLIKNFESLSLPRTPLSVTLFLWIIDKQESQPINNAILIEQVVKNLLEEINIENIYYDTFSFSNKQRLLAYVAKVMHDLGDENFSYRITYSVLLDKVTEYLKTRFSGSPQKVVDDFIRRGLLSFSDESYIKFKFAFLYHYFLSKHIGYDSEFKRQIFTIDNCLNYMDELDYYSGLSTDSEELLDLSQELLISVFKGMNEDITEKYDKIDPFFESKDSLSSRLNIDKVRQKPTEGELEKLYDAQLSNIPIKRSIEKREISSRKPLDKTLKFAAQIFRNLEEIDDFDKKKIALKNITTSSISFLILYRDSLLYHYIKNKKQPAGLPPNVNFGFFVRILPMLHQILISDWIGTQKTKPVILEKINSDKLTLNISEYERFLSLFIYADIKGSNYQKMIKDYLKNSKWRYLKDFGVMKLITYYYMRSKTKESDSYYLNLISDIKLSLKQLEAKGKSEFMRKLESSKNKNKTK
ncbi:metallophosphoesterase [Bacteroides sp. 51]|uniref:metallophosphoesterase n=1 Tax=Bacteroides sp. 51 TaxID=2302938 RepID=UPI0013D532DE|nr:metallophosphoesterase [Bacteroides sp. 51]NDV82249.1 hypothetical protein [Bacteroides sp. 51]